MTYTKIRLDFKYGPKGRFYRVILVKDNPSLFKLGVAFGTVLGATFEHCFLFRCKDYVEYVMACFMEMPLRGYKYLGFYHLSDLPDSFSYEYDTGDGWDFTCKKYKKTVELKSKEDIILLEGKGQGIWEDNICSLYALFNNEISPDFSGEDEEKGIYKPWNCVVAKYGDFDLPLNIEDENDSLSSLFEIDYQECLSKEKEYIKESHPCLDDYNEESGFETKIRDEI